MDPIRLMLSLEGKTLHTLGQRRPFDVLRVRTDGAVAVVIRPHSTGKPRNLMRREIELGCAVAQRVPRGTLSAQRLRAEKASEANPAYVATLLREIGAN